ncbi:MAG: hypothetical protein H5U32_02525 [Pseudomonas balearica]|uniref:hypothetical protein n=1 Tax=Stutzerimonas balearica TaxID=74829 RepID=UPI0019AC3BF9|nr:hypothetical protein [Stutzerimonas balearica]MBC7198103.1 hypothetical protein [Stutzerimonas balearica]
MNNQPNWDEAPEGYPIWVESKMPDEHHGWHREEGTRYTDPKGRYWPKESEGTDYIAHRRPEWNGEGTDYIAHRRPEWNGEGLPPAGIECEWLQFVHPNIHYVRVKVIGHDEGRAVFRITEGPRKGEYASCSQHMWSTVGLIFRPLLTAEQMAAKQREEKVSRIMDDAGIWGSAFKDDPEARLWATALVDKGYEPPKEQRE